MTRILIAHSDNSERQALRQALAAAGFETVALARDGQEAVQMAVQLEPAVALLEADLPVLDGCQAARMIRKARPVVLTLLLGERPAGAAPDTALALQRAMQAGARDLVIRQGGAWTGTDLAALVAALNQAVEADRVDATPEYIIATDPDRMPMTLSISGAKGGVGKTTLCTNLAVALAQEHQGEVVLVDLYSQFGDVATLLNLQPKRTMVELLAKSGELDLPLVEDHLETHDSGLKVLIGSVEPQPLDLFTTAFLEELMGVLKRQYRFIVVDVPPFLNPATLYMLGHSQAAVLVANSYDLTTASDTRKLLQTLRGGAVPAERLHVVLNRVSRDNQFQVADLEAVVGQPIAGVIPNDGRIVPASINNGVPFVTTHANSAIAQAVRALGRTLTRTGAAHPAAASASLPEGARRPSFLRALLGRAA